MPPLPPPLPLRILVLAVALAVPRAGAGQVTVMDEGTFSLFVGGTRVGREDFSIRAAPGPAGSAYVAQANVLVGERRTTVALNADSAGLPLRFQMTAKLEGGAVESVLGEARRGVWIGRTVRPDGESAREFRLPADAFTAIDGVAHPYWFVIRGGGSRAVGLLSPRDLRTQGVRLEEYPPEPLRFGTRVIDARHIVVRPAAGSIPLAELWADTSGRLLRVVIPSLSLEALRDDPPAETTG